MEPLPCPTFEDAFNAVETGKADLAMIPIENTIAGRVADIHHLLPESKLHIVGEYFLPIHFQLMVLPGVERDEIKTVHSHIHALGQCRKYIRKNGWKAVVAGDTAGAAKLVVARSRTAPWRRWRRDWPPTLYGLDIIEENVEDTDTNVTRFVVLTKSKQWAERPSADAQDDDDLHLPRPQRAGGALQGDGRLRHQRRQHDQAGELPARRLHGDAVLRRHRGPSGRSARVKLALEELRFFSREVRILGVYPRQRVARAMESARTELQPEFAPGVRSRSR